MDKRRTAGAFERLRVGDDLADTRPHTGIVTHYQIFHVCRRCYFRRRSLQRGAHLREIDDDGVLQDDADKRSAVLIECAFIFAKHAGGKLDSRAAQVFERIFDLTVRTALARNPEQWAASKAGRIYALKTIARIGKEAAKRSKGRTITAAALRSAADAVMFFFRQAKPGCPRIF